jgi:hypothetical protein
MPQDGRDVAKVFLGQALPDLKTAEWDARLGALPFKPKTKYADYPRGVKLGGKPGVSGLS